MRSIPYECRVCVFIALLGIGCCLLLDTNSCEEWKPYWNHSLPERQDSYRSIHLRKEHLTNEIFRTVVFCMIHEIYLRVKDMEHMASVSEQGHQTRNNKRNDIGQKQIDVDHGYDYDLEDYSDEDRRLSDMEIKMLLEKFIVGDDDDF